MSDLLHPHEVYASEVKPRKWIGSLLIILAAATAGYLCFYLGRENGKEIGFKNASEGMSKRLTAAPSSLPKSLVEDFNELLALTAKNDAADALLFGLDSLGFEPKEINEEWSRLIHKHTHKPVTMPMTINGKAGRFPIAIYGRPEQEGFKIAPVVGNAKTGYFVDLDCVTEYTDTAFTQLFGPLADKVDEAKKRVDTAPYFAKMARSTIDNLLALQGLKIVTKDFGK